MYVLVALGMANVIKLGGWLAGIELETRDIIRVITIVFVGSLVITVCRLGVEKVFALNGESEQVLSTEEKETSKAKDIYRLDGKYYIIGEDNKLVEVEIESK